MVGDSFPLLGKWFDILLGCDYNFDFHPNPFGIGKLPIIVSTLDAQFAMNTEVPSSVENSFRTCGLETGLKSCSSKHQSGKQIHARRWFQDCLTYWDEQPEGTTSGSTKPAVPEHHCHHRPVTDPIGHRW